MNFSNKAELINFLRSEGIYTKHSLGQNFLVDPLVLQEIINAAELNNNDLILEIGPGPGALTCELVKTAKKVVAIELDQKFAELLGQNIQEPNLQIVNSDVLKVNIPEIVGSLRYKVVANIPYYITSKILQIFLTQKQRPEVMVTLVQKEVAERICAKPGDMSTLSISVQAYGEPEIVKIVSRQSFFPAPEVDSAILKVNLAGKPKIGEIDEREFFRLVHIGYASRRKTLTNNLSAGLHIDKKVASDIIKSAGFSENVRAQELCVEDWINLINKIK